MRGFSTSRGHAAAQCVAISHRIPAQGRAQPCGVVAASDRILLSLPVRHHCVFARMPGVFEPCTRLDH
ncbi:hypothetical protein FDK35_26810, partial [Citrobacter werkmanii]|nr:hypothetical protein [Citrobacter werkmanii]